MDASMFLSKDLQALQAAPVASFMELRSKVSVRRTGLGDEVKAALQVAEGAGEEFSTESSGQAGERVRATGPFDQVERMLRTLIANLNDQANSDTNLNQWCLESREENDKMRVDLKSAQDQASSEILWSQAAISLLEDQITFFGAEVTRLDQQAEDTKKKAEDDQALLGKWLAAHTSAKEVLDEVVGVLKKECDIDDSELGLLQDPKHLLSRRPQQKGGLLQRRQMGQLRTKHGQC